MQLGSEPYDGTVSSSGQEEADPQEKADGGEMRGIRHRVPCGFGCPFE